MLGIFISYRRQNAQSAAGRLADHIKENLPGVPLFRDVETIEPGVDFVEAINRALQSYDVLLAVMAELVIRADGNWLQGRYASAATSERGRMAQQRIQ